MIYEINIKSHNAFPDYEEWCEAKSEDEAVEIFYEKLRGEFDKEFIRKNITVELNKI